MSEHSQLYRVMRVLPAFIESARSTFETMVFLPVSFGEPEPKRKGMPTGAISSTIALTGTDAAGNLSIIFPVDLAKSIFRSMMGMTENEAVGNDEMHDVVGELANMLAGGAKSRLQDQGVLFNIGLPSVVVGEEHYLDPPKDAQTVVVPTHTEKGAFFIELSF